MSKLTTERLETIATWREKYGNSANVMIPAEEAELMARQILAYEQAAKNPVAWVVGDEEIADFKNGREVCVMRDCDDEQLDYLPLYAAPVLPKQPDGTLTDEGTIPAMPEQKIVGWIFEDELPKNYPYDAMFAHSKVDVVRMFPVFVPSAAQPVIPEQELNTAKLINKFYERYPLETFANDSERAEALGYFMAGAELQCFGEFIAYDDHVQESE